MSVVSIKLKWGKDSFEVQVDTAGTGLALKQTIKDLTGVPVERQKLMAKGAWPATLKDDAPLSGLKEGHAVMLMGTAETVPVIPPAAITFVEDMSAEEKALKVEKIPAGLENLGNTCYMNATVQCLRKMPELQSALTSLPTPYTFSNFEVAQLIQSIDNHDMNVLANQPRIMSSCLANMCAKLDSSGAAVQPQAFVALLRKFYPSFNERTQHGMPKQQDAEEFFNLVTDCFKQTLTSSGPDGFGALMGVEVEETYRCTETDAESVVVKQDRANRVVCFISGGTAGAKVDRIDEGLKLWLDETIELNSDVLGRNALWAKSTRLRQLPKYLTVQFMRFYWQLTPNSADHAGVKSKILRAVAFPDVMDAYDLCNPALQAALRANRSADDKRIEEEMRAKRAKMASTDEGLGEEGKAEAKEEEAVKPAAGGGGGAAASMDVDDEGLDSDEAQALREALALSLSQPPPTPTPASSPFGPGVPADFIGHYELHGVVTHKGRDADSGHYIGWVRKEPGSDVWFKYNDDVVTECRTPDILRLSGGGDHDIAYFNIYRIVERKRRG